MPAIVKPKIPAAIMTKPVDASNVKKTNIPKKGEQANVFERSQPQERRKENVVAKHDTAGKRRNNFGFRRE